MVNVKIDGQELFHPFQLENTGHKGVYILRNIGESYWESGVPAYFNYVQVEGAHFPIGGSVDDYYIPPDIEHYRETPRIAGSNLSHYLLGGEGIPIFTEPMLIPDRDAILHLLGIQYDLQYLDEYPRLKSLLSLFTYRDEEQPRTMGWLMNHWKQRTGGNETNKGWYGSVFPRWGSGFDNFHYNALFWLGLNACYTKNDFDWYMFVLAVYYHCYLGRIHGGKWNYWAAYEKGPGFVGESFPPSTAKQWDMGPALQFTTMRDKNISNIIGGFWEHLLTLKDRKIWNGSGGVRQFARSAEGLLTAYNISKDFRYRSKAESLCNHAKTVTGDQMNFPNSLGQTSPWQGNQSLAVMLKWYQLGIEIDIDWIMERVEYNWNTNHYDAWGGKVVYYKRGPDEYGNLAVSAFTIPMLREAAKIDPVWTPIYEQQKEFLFSNIGRTNRMMNEGTIPEIEDVGYEYGPQGVGGWPKALKFFLQAMV